MDGKDLIILLKMHSHWTWIDLHSDEMAERCVRKELWGFPTLMNRFFDDVQPALVQAREARISAETAKAESVLRTFFPIKMGSQHRICTNENQEKHGASSSSRQNQWIPSASPEVTLESPGITEVDRRQDSLVCPVDHSPSFTTNPLTTTSEDREVLDITIVGPIEQQNIPDVGKNPDPHNEAQDIQEISSTAENTTEGLRIAHSNEEEAIWNPCIYRLLLRFAFSPYYDV